MGANGSAFSDLDPFADAIGTLATSNASASAIVMHPRSWQALTKLKEDTATSIKPLLQNSSGSGRPSAERINIWGSGVSQFAVVDHADARQRDGRELRVCRPGGLNRPGFLRELVN